MTLTIEIVQDIILIQVNPCSKFCDRTSIRSAMRAFIHGHTHRRLRFFITSTADAGGKKEPHDFATYATCV